MLLKYVQYFRNAQLVDLLLDASQLERDKTKNYDYILNYKTAFKPQY
jgi:hypothetical protein